MRAKDVVKACVHRLERCEWDCDRTQMGDRIDMEDLSGEIHKIRYYLMELGWNMDPAVDSAVEVPDEWC